MDDEERLPPYDQILIPAGSRPGYLSVGSGALFG
jgi:hypothetical protein